MEALVRISESLAKLRLDSHVRIEDVNEALRLFRVSTMAANSVDQTMLDKSLLQKHLEAAPGQGYNINVVSKCLAVMAMQGEILERNQGKLLKRIR